MLITNKNRRCIYCLGREVLKIEGDEVIDSSLIQDGEFFRCKDKEECNRNIDSESTKVTFGITDEGKIRTAKVTKSGEEIIGVEKDE